MAVNTFTDREAIEIVTALRDKLPLLEGDTIAEMWRVKDALAQVINLAEEQVKTKEHLQKLKDSLNELKTALQEVTKQ